MNNLYAIVIDNDKMWFEVFIVKGDSFDDVKKVAERLASNPKHQKIHKVEYIDQSNLTLLNPVRIFST